MFETTLLTMWYNCTLPRNDTINSTCCPEGNVTTALQQDRSACLLGIGNATAFNKCLAKSRNVTDVKCYLQDWTNEPPTSAAVSSRPKTLGWASLACIGLLLLGSVSGQVEPAKYPVCTTFVPDDQGSWNLTAETQHLILENIGITCITGVGGCTMPMGNKSLYFETVWAAQGPNGSVPVTGNFSSLPLPKDRAFADKVYIPIVPDSFFLEPGGTGLAAARTNADIIPGVFRDCTNGTIEVRGNVTVPEARGLYYFTTWMLADPPTGPDPILNESMPRWQLPDDEGK